jgi:hypothetical protein
MLVTADVCPWMNAEGNANASYKPKEADTFGQYAGSSSKELDRSMSDALITSHVCTVF